MLEYWRNLKERLVDPETFDACITLIVLFSLAIFVVYCFTQYILIFPILYLCFLGIVFAVIFVLDYKKYLKEKKK